MISKAVLCHILVIWGLAQATAQVSISRPSIPPGVRSQMIANGWRPLTGYESKTGNSHSSGSVNSNVGSSSNERRTVQHPVHGKLHDHMASSEKLSVKQTKQSQEYNPPSILGSFSVFGHSLTKVRPNESSKSHQNKKIAASETREFSFLVPPPREPVRYEIEPYRKIILRDNEAYLRQPQQYIISHPGHQQTEIRNPQFYSKGSGISVSGSSHSLSNSKNRPPVTEYNVGGISSQQQHQQSPRPQHIPFESLKLSNAKLYLQPPSANGPLNFVSEQQQATENLYDRYPSSLSPQNGQISHEGQGNFYSQINHPSPTYKTHTLERDPSFLVHESHEVSYATPASPTNAYGNFRPSSPYDSLHPPERYSTKSPDKFVPSKPDNVHRQHQQNVPYSQQQYTQNNGNLDNAIITSDQNYANGIANTYYISEQQSLTPPPATWSIPGKTKVTADINEVLPKANRPAKFNNEPSPVEQHRQSGHQQVMNYLFPQPEVQQPQQPQQQPQQHYSRPLPLINQQAHEVVYETPESLSLKHFNEQQFRLQQQLLQRDRDRLREQELQRQQEQIDLGRIAAVRNQEKGVTVVTHPTPETLRPTVEDYETTVNYGNVNQGQPQVVHEIPPPQIFPQEYHNPYETLQENFEPSFGFETGNTSVPDVITPTTTERSQIESTESPTPQRNKPRKPSSSTNEQRRRKPTTPSYNDRQQQQYLSTLSPNPIVQSPGTSFSYPSSTEATTSEGLQTISLYTETTVPSTTTARTTTSRTTTARTTTSRTTTARTTTTSTTTPKPRTRRPSPGSGNGGRRRRPTTTTTQEPDTTLPITYEQKYEDLTKYEKVENEASRRRRIKPSTTVSRYEETEAPITNTEKKRYEIQNYGNKLGNEQYVSEDYVTESQGQTDDRRTETEQVSQQSYSYNNEQDKETLFYTPSYDTRITTGPEVTEYETSDYPTSATLYSTQGNQNEYQNYDHSEIGKNVFTNIPLEELFVNTERVTQTTTTQAPTTTTQTSTTTHQPRRTTTAPTTRVSVTKSTTNPSTNADSVSTRMPSHRIRPMRFGNTTRPRFSIKDYKSRLDYRSRMSSTTTESSVTSNSRQKLANQPDSDNHNSETTTSGGRYRHMSRVSYRIASTTPSYHSRRQEAAGSTNSTTERVNKFAPKRRINNHLYRSKISTSTTVDPLKDDVDSTTARHNSVRHENVFSSSIRRRPQMKHAVYTQSSDIKTTRKESTEMVPEETSFYSPAYSQLLITETRTESSISKNPEREHVMHVMMSNEKKDEEIKFIVTPMSETEIPVSSDESLAITNFDNQSVSVESSTNTVDFSQTTTANSIDDVRQTEALVKSDNFATVNSQLEEDLFARASQSVADLTSSASALYDKPGMFKAVSVSPSAGENGAITNRFKISQEKPTLPIEAFFHELSNKN